MDTTEEVRTVFSWDTTQAESGATRMERAFDRYERAEKNALARAAAAKSAPKTGAAGGHGGNAPHGGGNAAMGVHDLLMGRESAALFRFGSAAKLAAVYASGMGVALEVGGRAFAYARAEMEETDKAAERLEQSYLKVSRAATFSSVADGPSKLSGTAGGLQEQITGERTQQQDLEWWRELETGQTPGPNALGRALILPGRAVFGGFDSVRSSFTGAPTTDEKMAQSEARERIAGQQLAKINRQTTAAYRFDQQLAFQKGEGGNPFEAQRMELGKKEEAEIADAIPKSIKGKDDENIRLIREKYALQREVIDHAERAADREIAAAREENDIRRLGGAVAVGLAKARLDLAEKALHDETVGTKAYFEAQNKREAASQAVALAQRGLKIERSDFGKDIATAGNRGNDEQRASQAAQSEVNKAAEKLRILRDTVGVKATEEELNAANLDLTRAQTAQEMLRRQQVAARLQLEQSIRQAPRDVRAAGALLGGASIEGAQRAGLMATAQDAVDKLATAKKLAELNKGDVASLQAQAAAARELATAQIAIVQHDQQIRRERGLQLEATRGGTAALQLTASGREDLADLAGERAQSSVAIKRANLEGNTPLARELAQQQRLRETKSIDDLYLKPDGSRRGSGEVNRRRHELEIKQSRFTLFNKALDRNGGLMDVHRDMGGHIESGVDPLTNERMNARQIAERNAAAHARVDSPKERENDSKTLRDILIALQKGLPKETN